LLQKQPGMKKGALHSERLLFPMIITILVIAGFQVYWLYDNYTREKRTLSIRTNVALRESVFELQASKLKLSNKITDPLAKGHSTMQVIVTDHNEDQVNFRPGVDAVEMINVLGDKEREDLSVDTGRRQKFVVSLNQPSYLYKNDSSGKRGFPRGEQRDKFIELLAGVDSLHDTLQVKEITERFRSKIREDKTYVAFAIVRLDSTVRKDPPPFNEVTIGFAKPVTYQLRLGNTFPFLMNRIFWPILFSVFIIAVTILTFILLYRTVLRQQRLAAMKNDFISNITHELKTPIATVGVAIEALKNFNAIDDPQRTSEYLDISQNELQRLSLLVDKVLKISMFEKREIELKKEAFDMQVLVNEVISIMKLQFEKHQAIVNLKTFGENFIIEADRLHITSVLYNLFDNALKYSKENPVIDVLLSSLPRDIIELKITDNGIGIAKEYQQRVFDKFFRVPMGNEHNIKGYGLGLSYVSEIVRRHMGFIVVDSELGKGTTFTVKIPRKEADVIYFDDKRKMIKKTIRVGFKKDKQA